MIDTRQLLALLTAVLHSGRDGETDYGDEAAIESDYDLAHRIGVKCNIPGWSRGVEK